MNKIHMSKVFCKFACPECATEGAMSLGADAQWHCTECGATMASPFALVDGEIVFPHTFAGSGREVFLTPFEDYITYNTPSQDSYGEPVECWGGYAWCGEIAGWKSFDESSGICTGLSSDYRVVSDTVWIVIPDTVIV